MKTLEIPGIEIADVTPDYDFWIIMAWWAPHREYRIFNDKYICIDAAQKSAGRLQETGWKHIQLLHVTPQKKGIK